MISHGIVDFFKKLNFHEFELSLEQKFLKFRGEIVNVSHFVAEELERFHKLEEGRQHEIAQAILHMLGIAKKEAVAVGDTVVQSVEAGAEKVAEVTEAVVDEAKTVVQDVVAGTEEVVEKTEAVGEAIVEGVESTAKAVEEAVEAPVTKE